MPWEPSDAKEHKKGLSDAQSKKWASTANSVRQQCMDAGEDEKTCDAKAIRVANAGVKANQVETKTEIIGNMSSLIRREILDKKTYLVSPVIMAVEGVMNELLYPAEELEKFPQAWNGQPVMVLHPRKDGKNMSANTPEQSAKSTPARLFNTKFEDGKLKSEIYMDPDKANDIDPQIMEKLENNETMEVSTGLFIEVEKAEGEFGGKAYKGIARNHRPDHLALLPDGGAACSWDEGAGMPRENAAEGDDEKDSSLLSRFGHWIMKKFKGNELNHGEIDSRLRAAIKAKLNLPLNSWVWLKEVFDTYCIYEHEDSEGLTRLYKQSYVIDSEDHVLLADEAVEVKEETSYPLVSPEANISSNKGDSHMDDEKRKEAVDALIANDKSDYAEEDRAELMVSSEKTLINLVGTLAANAVETPVPAPEPVVPVVPAPETVPKPEGGEEAPKTLSAEDVQNAISMGIKTALEANGKVPILERLIANEECKLSKEGLEAMSQADLEALDQSFNPGDYSGRGGVRANEDEGKIEPTPAMNWDKFREDQGIPTPAGV